jgi:hypothetical protein
MAVIYNSTSVTSGLMVSLDFQNIKCYPGSGTTVFDLSRNKYNGVVYNEATYSAGLFTFDGVNEYVGLPSPTGRWNWAPQGTTYNNALSIEIWVKSSDTGGQYISKPWNGNGEYNFAASHNDWWTVVGNQSHSLGFSSLATGNWEHAVFIINSTQKAVYRNGAINAAFTNHGITNVVPTTASNNEDLCFMTLYPYGTGSWNQPTHAINGQLAMVRIYNKTMTPQEITQNYNSARTRFGR